jgi:hypothetical protein
MRPGEIQRWRFINAAVQAGGALAIGFPTEFQIRQIAQMASIRAAKLSTTAAAQPGLVRANQPPQTLTTANLAPGNRADYLVQAPTVTQLTCYAQVQSVFGNVAPAVRQRIDAEQRAIRAPFGRHRLSLHCSPCVDPAWDQS